MTSKKNLLQGVPNPKLLHLASTPLAIMARHGLRTYAGISGDDPSNVRNFGLSYTVLLSVFGEGRLLGRIIIGNVGPRERYFVDVDREVADQGWSEIASLCVVHRIPSKFVADDRLASDFPVTTEIEFSMYRTVVQYAVEGKGMGSVIYETPPNFNQKGKKPHFLSFSNKVYLHPQVDSYLVCINYSISPDYIQPAEVKIEFHNDMGNCIGNHKFLVPAMDITCVNISELLANIPLNFISFTAASITSALIPISIIVNRVMGGVSVEHSHPPQEYIMGDWPIINGIKLRAAQSIFGRSNA